MQVCDRAQERLPYLGYRPFREWEAVNRKVRGWNKLGLLELTAWRLVPAAAEGEREACGRRGHSQTARGFESLDLILKGSQGGFSAGKGHGLHFEKLLVAAEQSHARARVRRQAQGCAQLQDRTVQQPRQEPGPPGPYPSRPPPGWEQCPSGAGEMGERRREPGTSAWGEGLGRGGLRAG